MRSLTTVFIIIPAAAAALACASVAPATLQPTRADARDERGTLAKIYYWRAKPGKLEEYSRYIRDLVEPIDREAQRAGAFLSVTTFVARDSTAPWTHMRVFVLRDSAQLTALPAALSAAGLRLEPDSARRSVRNAYSATLRDRVGDATVELLRGGSPP